MLAWLSFTITFGLLRLLTWAIHAHVAGLGNVRAGGVHIHHYLWGLAIVVAIASLVFVDVAEHLHQWIGLAFGIGLALIVDELALLIELKDVYWNSVGTVSVGIALLVIGAGGTILVFTRSPTRDE